MPSGDGATSGEGEAGAQAESGVVIELRRDASRPQRGPERGERRRWGLAML